MAALTVEELLSNGASLTEHNDIFHLSNGHFYCRLCWKHPSDMNRVIEHLGGHEHIRRMSIKAYHENPLHWVPVEQQPWTVIINCAAHCKLCNKAMVETHWNCAVHLRRVQWEMSQQQQSPWASSSSQSHIFSATTQSSSPLPHVKSCQHEMTSRGLVESPPPLPPVPPSPRQGSSGSGSAAYSPVPEHTPCDVGQSSATLAEMRGQQHENSFGHNEEPRQATADRLEQRSSGSCIATGVTGTGIAACRPAADQTPCERTPSLDKEGCVIYYV